MGLTHSELGSNATAGVAVALIEGLSDASRPDDRIVNDAGTQRRVPFSWKKLLLWTSVLGADVMFVSHWAGLYVAAVVAVSVASIAVMRRILGLGAAYLTTVPIGAVAFFWFASHVGGPPQGIYQVLGELSMCLAFGAIIGGPIALGITCLLQLLVDLLATWLPSAMPTSKDRRDAIGDMNAPTEKRWFRFRLRTVFVVLTVLSMVMAYAGAYYRLSRRGIEEAATYGLKGFFYIPIDEAMTSEDWSAHYRLGIFFAPANLIDQYIFGGPVPISHFTTHLS